MCVSSMESVKKNGFARKILGNSASINQNLPFLLRHGFGGNIRVFLIIFLGRVLRS